MTEQEWLECTDPTPMLEFLRGKASERKLRLFACACCRSIWHHFHDEWRRFVEIAELFADGKVDCSMLARQRELAYETMCESVSSSGTMPWLVTLDYSVPLDIPGLRQPATILDVAVQTVRAAAEATREEYFVFHPFPAGADFNSFRPQIEAEAEKVRKDLTSSLRCIFGNPFRPVTLDPRWLTSTVIDLPSTIYDERTFDRMPILADALMDAGCDSEEIINHCRSEAPHSLGCWVVDLLLGKK